MIAILNSHVGLLDYFARLCVLAGMKACTVADGWKLIEPEAICDWNHEAVTQRARAAARHCCVQDMSVDSLQERRTELTAVVVSWSRQLDYVRTHLPGVKTIAMAGNAPAARWFADQGVRNHYVFSPRMLGPLAGNVFLVRTLNLNTAAVPPGPASQRQGFGVHISHYRERFPDAFDRYQEALGLAPPEVVDGIQYLGTKGHDFTAGHLSSTRATIHVKSHGAIDLAVTNSIAYGVPVITDWQTVLDTYAGGVLIHDVTALIAHSPAELAHYLTLMARDNRLLDDLSHRTFRFAREYFQASAAYLHRFREFVARLE